MFQVRFTQLFESWLESLRDQRARRRIEVRIDRLAQGHFGDFKNVGDSVLEERVHYGPGYRLYFCQVGRTVIIMLAGGDKSTQADDIATAKRIRTDLDGDHDGH